jgi:hypothetical protein
MPIEQFFLNPPGSAYAKCSGGREQQNKANPSCVVVEECTELFKILEIVQPAGSIPDFLCLRINSPS